MTQKTKLVIIRVPDEKVAELERFLKNLKKKGELVIVRKSNGEILEISNKRTKKFKANYYDVTICGGKKEAVKFIRSLFINNLIPEGKKWKVYMPILDKFVRQYKGLRGF